MNGHTERAEPEPDKKLTIVYGPADDSGPSFHHIKIPTNYLNMSGLCNAAWGWEPQLMDKADVIVRLTGDCPLLDPKIIDKTVDYFLGNDFDYISTAHISKNQLKSTYPDGLDTEVFSFNSLKKTWKEAKLPSEREHVTPYVWKNPQIFKIKNLKHNKDLSHLRWTVDEECDLK